MSVPPFSNKNKDIIDWQEHHNKNGIHLIEGNAWQKFVDYYSIEDANLCHPTSLWNKVIRLNEKIKKICGTNKYTELEKSFNLPQKNTKVRDGPSQRQYNILEEQNKSLKAQAHV